MENESQDVQMAMTTFVESVTSWATQVLQGVAPIIQHMYEAIYKQYLQAGAPYGETQEGCLRWFGEIGEVRRLEAEAQRIIDHHQGLAYLRKRLAEKRFSASE